MNIDRRYMLGVTAGALASGAAGLSPAKAKAPMAESQNAGFYRYKIGSLEMTAITDGYAERPLEGFIKNADLAEVKAVLAQAAMPTEKLRIPFTTTVINTGDKLVMIDAGNGNVGAPTSGAWMANFKAAGFTPEQVDLIIFSHFHGDHINGYRLKDGTCPFTNAAIMVPSAEWAFWMDEGQMSRAPEGMKGAFAGVHRVFDPVKDKVVQYEAGKEIIPGVTALAAYGHTPGHTTYAVASGNDRHMLMCDTTNHPALFVKKPDWTAVFDMDGAAAITARRAMLDRAAADAMTVSFYHAPFPATGRIVKDGAGFALVPTPWSTTL